MIEEINNSDMVGILEHPTEVPSWLVPKGVAMRIICPIHGCQSVMCISPDLWDEPKKAEKDCGGIQVVYEFEGQLVDAFHLSAEFARTHDVHGGIVPLPDEHPKWVQAVTGVCKICFETKIRR